MVMYDPLIPLMSTFFGNLSPRYLPLIEKGFFLNSSDSMRIERVRSGLPLVNITGVMLFFSTQTCSLADLNTLFASCTLMVCRPSFSP